MEEQTKQNPPPQAQQPVDAFASLDPPGVPEEALALVKRLAELCKAAPVEQRQAIADALVKNEVVDAPTCGPQDWPNYALKELTAKLGIRPQDAVDSGRALELISQLCDFVLSMDRYAWIAWNALSPRSVHRRLAVLKTTLSRFVVGERGMPRDEVEKELQLLGTITRAMIQTIGSTGQVAMQHFREGSPDEIRVLVGPVRFKPEKRFWDAYVEKAQTLYSPAAVETIRKELAEFAERIVGAPR